MFDSRDTWNVVYIARTNRRHPPTSPNTVPPTKKGPHDWSSSHMKRQCACHEKWRSKIWENFAENGYAAIYQTSLGLFREWSQNEPVSPKTFRAPAIIPNFTKYCARHEKWQLNCTKYCTYHDNDSHAWSSSHMKNPQQCGEQQKSPSKLTKYGACHEELVYHSVILLFFDSAILWLYYSFTQTLLSFDSTILLLYFLSLYYSFTLLFFDSTILWLYYSFTQALLSLTLLFFYSDSIILWLYYSFTLLFFHSTIRLLYFSLTLLFFYSDSTILWLYYSFTLLFFDSTTLWLYYSFTQALLSFDSTSLLLYFSFTLLFSYSDSTILWL